MKYDFDYAVMKVCSLLVFFTKIYIEVGHIVLICKDNLNMSIHQIMEQHRNYFTRNLELLIELIRM